MFGYVNLFSFFSRYTFHSLSRYSYSRAGEYQSPGLVDRGSLNGIEDQAGGLIRAVQPVGEPEAPVDSIELSNDNPEIVSEQPPVTYRPEMIKADSSPEESEIQPENEAAETGNDTLLARIKSQARLNLNMVFNLAEFTQTVAAFAEVAEDGEINAVTYSDLTIGLHTDLKAKAFIKEDYRIVEGEPLPTAHSKQWSRFNQLEATLIKSRGFEAATFYKESLNISQKLRQTYSNGFLRVARKLSMRYTQDFQLNMRALNFYNTQAESLNQTGNLDGYVSNTESLADSPQASGELIGQFFETVQAFLDEAEDKLIDKIDSFFEKLAAGMGVDSSLLADARETMLSSINSFFDEVDNAVGSVKSNYVTAPEEPELPEPPDDGMAFIDSELSRNAEAIAVG